MSMEAKQSEMTEITFNITVGNQTKTFKLSKRNVTLIRVKSESNALFESISTQKWTLYNTLTSNTINDDTSLQRKGITQYHLTCKLEGDNDDESDEEDYDEDLTTPIIMDTGSYSTKAGFSGENTIRSEIATKVGRPRHQGVMVGMAQKDAYVGGSPSIGFSVGGAKDVNNFRDAIQQNLMPKLSSITYTGIFYDYYFQTENDRKVDEITSKSTDTTKGGVDTDMIEEDEKTQKKQLDKTETNKDGNVKCEGEMFYPSYCYAKCKTLEAMVSTDIDIDEEKKKDDNRMCDYYITCGLNSNIKESDFKRNTLNLVIVLDISGSMGCRFSGGGKTKMDIANQCLCALLDHLNDDDRFGLILFDTESIVFEKLNMVKHIDILKLKKRIKTDIKTRGGTDLECGYLKAKELLDGIDKNEDEIIRSDRIIYLTDMNPNRGITDKQSLLGLTETYVKQAIYSTFIGVGIDFNTDLVSYISNLCGCNYYAVKSEMEFKKRMDTEFEFMVTPLVFDLSLRLKSEGNSCTIANVFGSGDDKHNDDDDDEKKDDETLDFELMNVKTLFPSKTEGGRTKGGIIVIQLKKNNDNKSDILNFEIVVNYKDKYKKEHKNEQFVTFGSDDNEQQQKQEHYDNNGIRKAILLSQFVLLIKEWIKNDGNEGKPLTVSKVFKIKFTKFLEHFKKEMEVLQDEELEKEANILKLLSDSDEPLSETHKINKIIEYNQSSGVGKYCSAKQGILSFRHPVENGIITSWDDTEKVWHNTFYNELRIQPEEHSVLITELPGNPKANREKITQIMFETFNVPIMYLTTTNVLALYASGRETGMVIDFGFNSCRVAAIYAGCILSDTVTTLDVGGGDITTYLQKILIEKGYSFTTSMETEIVRDIKEQTGFVCLDYDDELKKDATECTVSYKMPDEAIINIDTQRFRCCEILFKPNLMGKQQEGIHKLIYKSIMKCHVDLRKDLWRNIVLTGGSSVFPGLNKRLLKELKSIAPDTMEVKIASTSKHEKQYGAFIGGSILSSYNEFDEICISKNEYDECGPGIVHRKCGC